jgi:hypothetical protein
VGTLAGRSPPRGRSGSWALVPSVGWSDVIAATRWRKGRTGSLSRRAQRVGWAKRSVPTVTRAVFPPATLSMAHAIRVGTDNPGSVARPGNDEEKSSPPGEDPAVHSALRHIERRMDCRVTRLSARPGNDELNGSPNSPSRPLHDLPPPLAGEGSGGGRARTDCRGHAPPKSAVADFGIQLPIPGTPGIGGAARQ